MKRKTWLAVLVLVIVLSASVAAVAVTNKDVLTATGQSVFGTYGTTSSYGNDPKTRIDMVVISQGGTPHHLITSLQRFEAGDIVAFGADGFYFVYNTATHGLKLQWIVKNNLTIPMTVQPSAQLGGCDLNRTGTEPPFPLHSDFAGASQGCPAHGPSVDTGSFLTFAQPSAADNTLVQMSFQESTLTLPSSSASSSAINNASSDGPSVMNKYLSLYPEEKHVKPAANPTLLMHSICPGGPICTIKGPITTLQPGETATITATVNANSGCARSLVTLNNALINYNVQAGGRTYKAYGVDQVIVFGKEESSIFGSS